MLKVVKRCSVSVEGSEWFPADNINVLCQRNGDKIICKACLPDGDKRGVRYDNIYAYENKLFLIPYSTRDIIVYDINHNKYRSIENSMTQKWREKGFKYSVSVKWEQSIYLFGRRMPYIVKMNMQDETIEMLEQAAMYLQKKQWVSPFYFACDYVKSENIVWIPIVGFGIVQLNFMDNNVYMHEIPRANSICKAEDGMFWISGKEKIVKWSPESGIVDSFDSGDVNTLDGEVTIEYYNGILRYKSAIECICIDVQSGQRWKESVPELTEDTHWVECSDEMLSVFNDMEKQIFQESDFQTFEQSCSTYFEYLRLKDGEEKKYVKENIGIQIYSSMKGC